MTTIRTGSFTLCYLYYITHHPRAIPGHQLRLPNSMVSHIVFVSSFVVVVTTAVFVFFFGNIFRFIFVPSPRWLPPLRPPAQFRRTKHQLVQEDAAVAAWIVVNTGNSKHRHVQPSISPRICFFHVCFPSITDGGEQKSGKSHTQEQVFQEVISCG